MGKTKHVTVCLSMMVVGAAGLAGQPTAPPAAAASAVATVKALGAARTAGTVRFTQLEHGVRIDAEVAGLTPGAHGFHIHEFGDCSAADGSSAGGHFNPDQKMHGGPGMETSHAGDYGNLTADAEGRATLSLVSHRITLDHGPQGVLGRSVVVHEKTDDMTSQPAGNAGPRIGCGVILLQGGPTTPVLKK